MADAAADMEDLVPDATRALRAGHTADYHHFSDREVALVRQRLLAWYDANKRSMPWRKEPLVVRLAAARNRLDLPCAGAYRSPAALARPPADEQLDGLSAVERHDALSLRGYQGTARGLTRRARQAGLSAAVVLARLRPLSQYGSPRSCSSRFGARASTVRAGWMPR